MAALCGSGKPGWSERHSGSRLRKRSSASSRQLYYQLPLFAIVPESRATRAQFRIQEDKMLLRVEDADDKGREYSVVSLDPAPGNKRSAPRRDWTQC